MKYQLLLKDILRYTERANLQKERGDLMRAVEIMLVVPKSADDMMNVGRLNGFPGKLTAQGKLIKQGILLFCDITPLLSNLDSSSASEILAQYESKKNSGRNNNNSNKTGSSSFNSTTTTSGEKQHQQLLQHQQSFSSQSETGQQQQTSDLSTSGSNSSNNSLGSGSNRQILNTSLVGTTQMNDQSRIVLNQLLSNSNLIKLKERQTFLFEQTIIFSEVVRKSNSSSSSSSNHYHSVSAAPASIAAAAASSSSSTFCSNNINSSGIITSSNSSSNVIGQQKKDYSSLGGSKKVNSQQQSNYLASSQANSSNYHPCYPHSHNQFTGAVENCCTQPDCTLPQSGSSYCSRLLNLNENYSELGTEILGGQHQESKQQQQRKAPSSSSSNSTNIFTSKRRESSLFHNASAVFQSSFNSNSSNLVNNQQQQTNHVTSSNITNSANSQLQQTSLPSTLPTQPNPQQQTLNNNRYNHHHHHHSANLNQSSVPQYYSMPSYEYKNHLSINKVALIDKHYGVNFDLNQLFELLGDSFDVDVESRRFMLKSRDPNQENVIYLLQTGCSYDRDEWVCSIRSMLECQLDFLRALQSPIAYQRGLTKEG